jgi:hypothetical protein
MKFTVQEKDVKARDGDAYDVSRYTEGVDYVTRKAFKSVRRVFRKGFLDGVDAVKLATVVDPSLVEHKRPNVIIAQEDDGQVVIRPAVVDGLVRAARVVKKHLNQRWVETDLLGRVWVGEKGNYVKVGQIINVRNGELYLKR